MTGPNEKRSSMRASSATRSKRSPKPWEGGGEDVVSAITQAISAGGFETGFAEEMVRSYLATKSEPPTARSNSLDPLTRHVGIDADTPASTSISVLTALPRSDGFLYPDDSRSITHAVQSPQVRLRRGGAQRARRDERRKRRREYDKKRLEKVRQAIFAAHGQAPDVPDFPALRPEVYGTNLKVMQDGTGRKALEVCAKLPLTQQMELYRLGHAALPWARWGRLSSFTRRDLAAASGLPQTENRLKAALERVRDDIAPSLWFRRLVCAAWGMWSHRGRTLSEKARKAFRGAVFVVEGFCQNALSWLVPQPDGTPYSRSVLWGPTGPFTLLGGESHRLGRGLGESGAGLWKRWQSPAGVAKYKGPTRVTKKGKLERFALSQTRFDKDQAGRTALSLARRARGTLRELARMVVSSMTPWVRLPEPRPRTVLRPQEKAEQPSSSAPATQLIEARAPP